MVDKLDTSSIFGQNFAPLAVILSVLDLVDVNRIMEIDKKPTKPDDSVGLLAF